MLPHSPMTSTNAISPHPWLEELARRVEAVIDVGDAKSVHQLRVAAGRLSVWIELGGRAALRDDLRRLRRLVSHVRDVDVLLARRTDVAPDVQSAETRAEELRRARAILATSAPQALLVGLACVPWPEFEAAERCARGFATRVVRAARVVEQGDHAAEAVHRWRRRVRRARYALEWLGRDSTRERELQDVLGAWHDAAIEEVAAEVSSSAASDAQDPAALDSQRNAARRERDAMLETALSHFATDRERWNAWARA